MAVFDSDGHQIWEEHSKIDDNTFSEAIQKMKDEYSTGVQDGVGWLNFTLNGLNDEQNGEKLIELEGGTQFYTQIMSSPLPLIKVHQNYKEVNKMFVVCGQQREQLLEMFQNNLTDLI